MTIKQVQAEVHELAKFKGWYDGITISNEWILSRLMLMVSELAEACEEVRMPAFDRNAVSYSDSGKPEGFGIELADCVIRILDMCGAFGINMEEMIAIKHDYNKTRPYKHGKTA